MDYSNLKAAIKQAQDRFKMANPEIAGPPLPDYTSEEAAVAEDNLGMAMASIQGPKLTKALRTAEEEAKLARAFEYQKAQRDFEFAKRNAQAVADSTGKPYIEPSFPKLELAAKEATPKVENELANYLLQNKDIAAAINSVAARKGVPELRKLAGADSKFQAIRDLLAQKAKKLPE